MNKQQYTLAVRKPYDAPTALVFEIKGPRSLTDIFSATSEVEDMEDLGEWDSDDN